VLIGFARLNITPDYPVRLSGYNNRATEVSEVEQRLWTKAIAIGSDDQSPAVLVTIDNLGVPGTMTTRIAARLRKRFGLNPERFAVCASHTHSAPALIGVAPLIVKGLSPEELKHLEKYTRQVEAAIEQVAADALEARQPGRLSYASGAVDFAMNRRVLKDGKWTKFGEMPYEPVDQSLPVLFATDTEGGLRGVLVNYACHCTTLGGNYMRLSGDWAGYAQEFIERDHPGAVAMISIGCGADANPSPRGEVAHAEQHGQAVLREVNRLLKATLAPLPAVSKAHTEEIELPFAEAPTREEFEARAKQTGPIAVHAQAQLERLAKGEKLATLLLYRVQAWQFGNELGMVFLPGEVVVDYQRRLKKQFTGKRLWVNAYANASPCYIASARIIGEGGYEVDSSMYYYDQPTRFDPKVENLIVSCVERLLPEWFAPDGKSASSKWEPDISKYEAADRSQMPEPGGIVFIGSSTINKWKLSNNFSDLPVLNRGFGGSQLADSVEFAHRIVTPYRPKTVVLYAGDNDLARGKTPDDVARDFREFVAKVRHELPETKIIYLSVKPSLKRWEIVELGREANRRIQEYIAVSGDKHLEFVDIGPVTLGSDGKPRPEFFVADGLHLSDEGYKAWAEVLRPHLFD
jgi:lysophospholipase L1-like esterase